MSGGENPMSFSYNLTYLRAVFRAASATTVSASADGWQVDSASAELPREPAPHEIYKLT